MAAAIASNRRMTGRVRGTRRHWNVAMATVSSGTWRTGVQVRCALFSASSSTQAPLAGRDQYLAHTLDFVTGDRREHGNRKDLPGRSLGHYARSVCKACEGILLMAWNRVVQPPADAVRVERGGGCRAVGDAHDLEVVDRRGLRGGVQHPDAGALERRPVAVGRGSAGGVPGVEPFEL